MATENETPGAAAALVEPSDVESALLDGIELPELDDQDAIARLIAMRILTAPDATAVLVPSTATPAQDVLGVPLEVDAVRWQRSGFEGGAAIYAVLEATRLDNGEPVTVTCSGRNVMAQLLRLVQLGSLPVKVQIIEAARETSRGYRPLWLAPA